MMIKIGRMAVINMKAIRSVHIIQHVETTDVVVGKGFWGDKTEKKKKESLAVKVYYLDSNDKDTEYELYGLDGAEAEKVRDEVVSQIKELELETMSMVLENAIRSGGNG